MQLSTFDKVQCLCAMGREGREKKETNKQTKRKSHGGYEYYIGSDGTDFNSTYWPHPRNCTGK